MAVTCSSVERVSGLPLVSLAVHTAAVWAPVHRYSRVSRSQSTTYSLLSPFRSRPTPSLSLCKSPSRFRRFCRYLRHFRYTSSADPQVRAATARRDRLVAADDRLPLRGLLGGQGGAAAGRVSLYEGMCPVGRRRREKCSSAVDACNCGSRLVGWERSMPTAGCSAIHRGAAA